MTNERAKEVLQEQIDRYGQEYDAEGIEALETAIKVLEQQPCEDWYDVPSDKMTLEQARQAVKDLRKKLAEYLEQQPCEDCISRESVENITWEEPSYTDVLNVLAEVREKIRQLPSVTPKSETITDFADRCRECGTIYGKLLKPKTGQWLHPYKSNVACECSVCHRQMPITNDFKFCPNCGTRMIEPQESERDD